MKFLFDLFPVILFFVAFKFFGIFTATAVAIVATIAQIIYVKIKHGVVEKMLLLSGVIITVFGGATLLLKDPTFIQWKPSILYWLFAAGLLASQFIFNKNPMRSLMEKQVKLPDNVWSTLNIAWALLFTALGFINLYVAFNYSQDTWVNFKLFGITGIMFGFIIVQTIMISKYLPKEDNSKEATKGDAE
ncbi:MAG: septation protein A [Methylotenera sp.]|nr:septation protein A [Methylotenera sp.]